MTTSAARTDVHRPSAPEFDPADYTCLGVFDFHPESGDARTLSDAVNDAVERGYRFAAHQRSRGGCGHCGANIRYAALMGHGPTHELIYVGETCLGNRFESMTKAEFDRLRKAAALDRGNQRIKKAFLAACEAHPELVWATYAWNIRGAGGRDYADWALCTLADIARKARQYGDPSDKQLAFAARLLAEVEAKAAAYVPAPPKAAVPTGRIVVEGVVLGAPKWHDNDFGGCWKMTVRLDSGARAFGSVPKGLFPEQPWSTGRAADERHYLAGPAVGDGDRVRFTATVKASERPTEPDFGYFSRPAKAELLVPTS